MPRDGDLRKLYAKHLSNFHWTSVESPFTIMGIPDSNYCCNGVEGWIENKIIRSGDSVGIRPEQVAWLERRMRAGGRVFIGVRWPRRDDAFYLLRASAARPLLGSGLAALPPKFVVGNWAGGPQVWEWPKIGYFLTCV